MRYRLTVKGKVAIATLLLLFSAGLGSLSQYISKAEKIEVDQVESSVYNSAGSGVEQAAVSNVPILESNPIVPEQQELIVEETKPESKQLEEQPSETPPTSAVVSSAPSKGELFSAERKKEATIYFGPDQGSLREKEKSKLQEIEKYLKENPSLRVILEGNINNTDGKADSDFGKELSLQRAEVVKDALIQAGIDENRIIVVSNGSSQLLGKGKDIAWKNRRTDVFIEGEWGVPDPS